MKVEKALIRLTFFACIPILLSKDGTDRRPNCESSTAALARLSGHMREQAQLEAISRRSSLDRCVVEIFRQLPAASRVRVCESVLRRLFRDKRDEEFAFEIVRLTPDTGARDRATLYILKVMGAAK